MNHFALSWSECKPVKCPRTKIKVSHYLAILMVSMSIGYVFNSLRITKTCSPRVTNLCWYEIS